MKSDDHMILKIFPRYVFVCLSFAFASYYIASSPINTIACIALCLGLAAVALVFYLLAKKAPALYMISTICNTIGAAFAVSIYYQKVGNPPSLRDIFILTLIHLALFFAVDLLIGVSKKHKTKVQILSVLIFTALLIFFIVEWIAVGSAFYSLGFFMALISLLYVLARVFISDEKTDKIPKYIAVTSFSGYILVAAIVAIIVLFIITEGEILEGIGEGLFEGTAELFCEIFECSHNKKTKL